VSKLQSNKLSLRLVEEEQSAESGYRRKVGELWTAQQRQMHSLHYVVSYRASFKPELPDFCIRRYSKKGDVVFDPFSGRGTTALQANLLGRVAWASDVNPLAVRMTRAKLNPAGLDEIVLRLNEVDFRRPVDLEGYQERFAPFYHPDTYRELLNLRAHIQRNPDRINNFIELIAVSRLHGHSPGFFSVYSFPQISIPAESQRLINRKRGQRPEYRAVAPRIIRKAAQALRDSFTAEFFSMGRHSRAEISDATKLSWIPSGSVDLVVTSPPFLDKVDYVMDNWLECWFCGVPLDGFSRGVVMSSCLEEWAQFIRKVLAESLRIVKPRGKIVIEVGEVETAAGLVNLDEIVAEESAKVSFQKKRLAVDEVLINKQSFTKLANCFNVTNNRKGTNTNRLVVMSCRTVRR
jgi:hypothetical protein